MELGRILRHLTTTPLGVRRAFPARALDAIEHVIAETEAKHDGQIRFAVEHALDLPQVAAGMSARERALEVFGKLRVWDTEQNNGVLIYVLLADRDVEIIADRGIHARVGPAWEAVCRQMESRFRAGEFEAGVVEGVRAVGQHLQQHFARRGPGANELPDRPVVL
jgi:uncharacterized membrane protein